MGETLASGSSGTPARAKLVLTALIVVAAVANLNLSVAQSIAQQVEREKAQPAAYHAEDGVATADAPPPTAPSVAPA
jgi:hypothetical protein